MYFTESNAVGKIYERSFFGKCPWQSEDYESWWECVRRIIKTGDQPGTDFTKIFCKEIAWRLGYNDNDNVIEFFSAVDSPLDRYHGIDGFVVMWLSEEHDNAKIVTLDITLKPEKDYKSDFLITPQVLGKIHLLITNIVLGLRKSKKRVFYNDY